MPKRGRKSIKKPQNDASKTVKWPNQEKIITFENGKNRLKEKRVEIIADVS